MTRTEQLADILDAIGALTRDFAASGRRPFAGRPLGRSHYDILFALSRADEGLSVGALAARLAVTSGAVSQLLDALRGERLVTSEPDPADARRRVIRLTDDARGEVDAFQRRYIDDLSPRFAALDDAEVAELARLLARVGTLG